MNSLETIKFILQISLSIGGVLLAIIGFMLGRLLYRFEELIKNQAKANEILIAHQTRLDNMDHRFNVIDKRLNDHAERVREIELSHASCVHNK